MEPGIKHDHGSEVGLKLESTVVTVYTYNLNVHSTRNGHKDDEPTDSVPMV